MGREVTKFILWTTHRSGSTFIRLWLNNHPNVRCHSEIFLDKYKGADGFRVYCEGNPFRRLLYNYSAKYRLDRFARRFVMNKILMKFLDEIFNNPLFTAPWTDYEAAREYVPRVNIDSEMAAGFQLMYGQLAQYSSLQKWITDNEFKIIHVYRENLLRKYYSEVKAKNTQQYHVHDKESSPQKLLLNPETIIDDLKYLEKMELKNKARFSDKPLLEFTYEDFFSDGYANIYDEVCGFLEIDTAEMEFPSWLKKLNPGPLDELIENYEEISNLLRETPFRRYLD